MDDDALQPGPFAFSVDEEKAMRDARQQSHGFKETEASITMKLKRGTFPATLLLACLAALELESVALEDI